MSRTVRTTGGRAAHSWGTIYDRLYRAYPRHAQASPGPMTSLYGYDSEHNGEYQKYVDETLSGLHW